MTKDVLGISKGLRNFFFVRNLGPYNPRRFFLNICSIFIKYNISNILCNYVYRYLQLLTYGNIYKNKELMDSY